MADLEDDGKPRGRCGFQGRARLPRIDEGLQDDRVRHGEGIALPGIDLFKLFPGVILMPEAQGERTDGGPDQAGIPCRLTGERDARFVDLATEGGRPAFRKYQGVCGKGVRHEDPRSCLAVGPVEGKDGFRPPQVHQLHRLTREFLPPAQDGTHRAAADKDPFPQIRHSHGRDSLPFRTRTRFKVNFVIILGAAGFFPDIGSAPDRFSILVHNFSGSATVSALLPPALTGYGG